MTFVRSFIYMRGLMLFCLMKCLTICLLLGIFLFYMMLDICLNHIPNDGEKQICWAVNWMIFLCLGCWWYCRKNVAAQRRKKYEKVKFVRIGKYKYVTGRLAFLITGGRTAGLIYVRPYVSQVQYLIDERGCKLIMVIITYKPYFYIIFLWVLNY